ncbi:MAG: hypothetical protein JW982_00690 [Spirochaetes bacterium]|nr:hypothetical protein [Spirochaetota bacterium]
MKENCNLKSALNLLVNKTCWGVVYGNGSGSIIELLIGDKLKRDKPLKNNKLAEDISALCQQSCRYF